MSQAQESHSRLSEKQPFAGLVSFEEAEAQWFRGRSAEIEDLYRRVRGNKNTVCFSRSGLGKTSLLRAGLFPKLRRNGFLPVYIRLGYGSRALDLKTQVLTATRAACVDADGVHVESPEFRDDESLWEYFHRAEFWRGFELLTPVLVFDQFEELFTLCGSDDERFAPFVTQLSDLMENRIPQADARRLHQNPEFSFDDQPYRVILSLREDFLADLENLRQKIPSLRSNRMRLLPMNGRAALEVVSQIDASSPEVAEQIVRFVTNDKKGLDLELLSVEPALLSIFCRELNSDRLEQGLEHFTEKLLRDRGDLILDDFYDDTLKRYGKNEKAIRKFIEDQLLTTSGRRISVALEDVLSADNPVDTSIIDRLISDRLIRRFERDDVDLIELTHDLLTSAIEQSRRRRRAAALTRQRWRTAASIVIGVIVSAICLGAAVRFFQQEEFANKVLASFDSLQQTGFELADVSDQLTDRLDELADAGELNSAEAAGLKDLVILSQARARAFRIISVEVAREASGSGNQSVRDNAKNTLARGMQSPDESVRLATAVEVLEGPDVDRYPEALDLLIGSLTSENEQSRQLAELNLTTQRVRQAVLAELLMRLEQDPIAVDDRDYANQALQGVLFPDVLQRLGNDGQNPNAQGVVLAALAPLEFDRWLQTPLANTGPDAAAGLLARYRDCRSGSGCPSARAVDAAQRVRIVAALAAINAETNSSVRRGHYQDLLNFFRSTGGQQAGAIPARTIAIEEIHDRLEDRQFGPAGRDIVLGYLLDERIGPTRSEWGAHPDRDLIAEMLVLLTEREAQMGSQARGKSGELRVILESYRG